MDLTVAAIPFYFGSMGAGHRYLARRAAVRGPSAGDYERRDTIASLPMGSASWWCRWRDRVGFTFRGPGWAYDRHAERNDPQPVSGVA